jgi:hypothetical protein
MSGHNLITPTHRSIRRYYENVAALRGQGVLNEMSVRSPFESLLQETARLKDWTFIAELSGKSGGALIRPDGTLRDRNSLPRGYWEAKDTQDDLDTEIKKKIARGYPLSNIIFEDTQTGVLFQSKQKINGPYTLGNPRELVALLNQFFSYTEPDIEGFGEAVDEFKERVPSWLARSPALKSCKIDHPITLAPAFDAASLNKSRMMSKKVLDSGAGVSPGTGAAIS